ncbi:signal peptidase, endoplasmic reticulum-type [Eubacterium ruminantium]|nr:signal peptidase, endoplasmic reticulum-type [Eubacterium ruminantium]
MKKVLKVLLDVLAWVLLITALLVTLVVFAAGKNNGVANIFGYTPLTVESDSMSPTFKKDDLIVVKKVKDLYQLKEGDVITFYTIIDGKRVLNTHRIVAINQAENSRSFTTRGDNNQIDDYLPAYASDIVGKWTGTRLKGMGKAMDFLRTKKGFFICIIIPLALFFLFELYKFISVLIDAKKSDITEEDEEEIKRKAVEEYLAAEKAKAEAAEKAKAEAEVAADEAKETADAVSETAENEAKEAVEEVSDAVDVAKDDEAEDKN